MGLFLFATHTTVWGVFLSWTKISVFSADISSKYRFSVSLEKKNAQKFLLSDFSRKFPIFLRNFPIFSQFFPFVILLQKSQKIVSGGIRTQPKCLKVAHSNHQAIDCTYYI